MGDNKNPRKRTATNKTPYPTTNDELPISDTPVSLDTQMYDIFGTPAMSTSSEPPASPPTIATPSLCAASPPEQSP